MAPVHHHFELKGLAEPKIIVRFWIVSILCGARGAAVAEAALTWTSGGRTVVGAGRGRRAGSPRSELLLSRRAPG